MNRITLLALLLLPVQAGAAAQSLGLTIEQGATWVQRFDADLNLTGCDCTPVEDCLAMEIRSAPGGRLLAAPSLTVQDSAGGVFEASLTANQTGQLTFRSGVFDVELTCAATVTRLFEGQVLLRPGVTTDEVAPGEFPAPGTPPGEVYLRTADAASTYLRKSTTYDEETAQSLLAWTPDGNHGANPHAAFELRLGGSDFYGDRDHVVATGWNTSGIAGEPRLYWQWEDFYRTTPAGPVWMEFFLQYISADSLTSYRPIFVHVDRDTHESSVQFHAEGSGGYHSWTVDDRQNLKLVYDGLQVLNGLATTWTGTGAKNMLRAVNNAGTATYLVLSQDQFNRIALGPANVIMVGTAGIAGGESQLAFFGQTLRTKRTVSGSCYGNPACSSLMTALGDSGYGLVTDSTTAGVTTATQAVSATPSLGTCDASARGQFAYVDDTNDAAVSRMCFCGTAADDTTYAWRRADAPATTCP